MLLRKRALSNKRVSAKLLTLLICITLVTSFFTGCSLKKGEETGKTASKLDETAKPILPYHGEQIVYYGISQDLGLKQNLDTPVVKEYFKRINEEIGDVKIEWQLVPGDEFSDKLQLLMNTGDIPDIMWVQDPLERSRTYGDTGMFLDWNKYKEYMPNYQEYLTQYVNLTYTINEKGENFAICDIEAYDFPMENWFYNKTMLDKYGLSVPNTADEFVDAMRNIKKADPNVIPYQSFWQLGYVMKAMNCFHNSHKTTFFNRDTKKWEHFLTDAKANADYKALIEFTAMLWKEKLINPEVATMSWEQEMRALSSCNWAFTYQYYCTLELSAFESNDLPIEIKYMSPPADKDGTSYVDITIRREISPIWSYFANAKTKYPELLAAYVDFTLSKEASQLYYWGVENVTYKKLADGSNQFFPEFLDGTKKLTDYGVQDILDLRFIIYKDRAAERSTYGPLSKEGYQSLVKDLRSGRVREFYDDQSPLFSQEQSDTIGKIMSPIETYVEENVNKFVFGKRDLSEWDDFIKQAKSLADIDKLLDIYNSSEQLKYQESRLLQDK